jgi:hypothetical protein
MLFNSKLLLGFLLKQDIKDVEGVFSECKLEQPPSTQAPPFAQLLDSKKKAMALWLIGVCDGLKELVGCCRYLSCGNLGEHGMKLKP